MWKLSICHTCLGCSIQNVYTHTHTHISIHNKHMYTYYAITGVEVVLSNMFKGLPFFPHTHSCTQVCFRIVRCLPVYMYVWEMSIFICFIIIMYTLYTNTCSHTYSNHFSIEQHYNILDIIVSRTSYGMGVVYMYHWYIVKSVCVCASST